MTLYIMAFIAGSVRCSFLLRTRVVHCLRATAISEVTTMTRNYWMMTTWMKAAGTAGTTGHKRTVSMTVTTISRKLLTINSGAQCDSVELLSKLYD